YDALPKYTVNSVINCMLAPAIYPGWTCRFYVDDTVPPRIVELLGSFEHAEVVTMPRHADSRAMLWRYLAAAEPDVDAFIARDADSWVSTREAVCVEAWLQSGRTLHIIRDHCYHSKRMMGGMWGVRGGVLHGLPELIAAHPAGISDQDFLAE